MVEGEEVVVEVDHDVSYLLSLPGNNKIMLSMGLDCWPIFDCGATFIKKLPVTDTNIYLGADPTPWMSLNFRVVPVADIPWECIMAFSLLITS